MKPEGVKTSVSLPRFIIHTSNLIPATPHHKPTSTASKEKRWVVIQLPAFLKKISCLLHKDQ
jgi:hypothetical protein